MSIKEQPMQTTYADRERVRIHDSAAVTSVAIRHLLTVLESFEGDFGGPENEMDEWLNDLLEAKELIEHILNVTA